MVGITVKINFNKPLISAAHYKNDSCIKNEILKLYNKTVTDHIRYYDSTILKNTSNDIPSLIKYGLTDKVKKSKLKVFFTYKPLIMNRMLSTENSELVEYFKDKSWFKRMSPSYINMCTDISDFSIYKNLADNCNLTLVLYNKFETVPKLYNTYFFNRFFPELNFILDNNVFNDYYSTKSYLYHYLDKVTDFSPFKDIGWNVYELYRLDELNRFFNVSTEQQSLDFLSNINTKYKPNPNQYPRIKWNIPYDIYDANFLKKKETLLWLSNYVLIKPLSYKNAFKLIYQSCDPFWSNLSEYEFIDYLNDLKNIGVLNGRVKCSQVQGQYRNIVKKNLNIR